MIAIIKSLHLLGLVLALGAGITRLTLGPIAAKTPDARPHLQPIIARFTSMNYAGLILLWVTGLWLFFAGYIGATLSPAFHLKMLSVVVLTGLAMYSWFRAKRGAPLAPALALRLGRLSAALAVIAVVFATLAFS